MLSTLLSAKCSKNRPWGLLPLHHLDLTYDRGNAMSYLGKNRARARKIARAGLGGRIASATEMTGADRTNPVSRASAEALWLRSSSSRPPMDSPYANMGSPSQQLNSWGGCTSLGVHLTQQAWQGRRLTSMLSINSSEYLLNVVHMALNGACIATDAKCALAAPVT